MKINELQNKVPKGSQKRYKHPFATDDPEKYVGKWEKYDEPQGINSKAAKKVLKGNKVKEGINTNVEVTPIPIAKAKRMIKNAVGVVYAASYTVGDDTYIAYAEKDFDYPGLYDFGFNIVKSGEGTTPEVYAKTGKHTPLRVYSGAASALSDFVEKYNPPAVSIQGASSAQMDLYDRLIKNLASKGKLRNYVISKSSKYPIEGLVLKKGSESFKEANALPGGPWPQKGDYKSASHEVIPNDDIIDFFGDTDKNPGSKAPSSYVRKQKKKLNTDSYKKPFEEAALATSKGYKASQDWSPSFMPDPEDAPAVTDFKAPGEGEDGIRFIIDLGVNDEMKDKARNKDNRNNKSVKQVTEMVRRPSQRNFTAEYEIVANNGTEEVIGKATVEEGVIKTLAVKEASSKPSDEILRKLVGSIVKEADMANANLSIRVEDRHDLDIIRFLERFGFRHVGEGVMKRNAGSAIPPLI